MTETISITNMPPIRTSNISVLVSMATAAIPPPMPNEPVSPMNTFAGCALKTRKPSIPPIIAAENMADSCSLACSARIVNAPNAIAPEPASNPSTPSVKLTAFVVANSNDHDKGIIEPANIKGDACSRNIDRRAVMHLIE